VTAGSDVFLLRAIEDCLLNESAAMKMLFLSRLPMLLLVVMAAVPPLADEGLVSYLLSAKL
jgi:hypothetical protein